MKKVAVVTGGTGALGKAVCRRFADDGYEVHLTAQSQESADAYDGPGEAHIVDLVDYTAARAWAHGLDTPVHAAALIAGGFAMASLDTMQPADYSRMFDMNVRTAANSLSVLIPLMQQAPEAAAVLVGAQSYKGAAGMALYAASKAAVVSLSMSAALELQDRNIRVNCILPNIIDSPANRRAMPNADYDTWAKPEELAQVVAFLCSSTAGVVNGAAIPVGRSI